MSVLFIIVVFIVPVVTIVLNVMNVKKQGKRGFAIACQTIVLCLLSFFCSAMLNLNGVVMQMFVMIAMLCMCASTFFLSRIGGFSAWKTGRTKLIAVGVLIVAPFATIIGVFSYEQYLLSSIINFGYEDSLSWTQKIPKYEELNSISDWLAMDVEDKLLDDIRRNCPDLSTFANLSEEDRLLYYNFMETMGKKGNQMLNELLIDSVESEQQFSNILTFYNTTLKSDAANSNLDFMDLPVTIPITIEPDEDKELSAQTIRTRGDKEYVIFSYERDEWKLNSIDMINHIAEENIPESLEDIDYAVVISSTFHYAGTYTNGATASNRNVNVCVYDYATGELLGKIDSFYTYAPNQISYDSYGVGSMPMEEIKACLENFFKY